MKYSLVAACLLLSGLLVFLHAKGIHGLFSIGGEAVNTRDAITSASQQTPTGGAEDNEEENDDNANAPLVFEHVLPYATAIISADNGPFTFDLAYRYSETPNARPNSYKNLHRLTSLALTWAAPNLPLSLSAGRTFTPLIERNIFIDGGAITFQKEGLFSLTAFGGLSMPTPYEKALFNSDVGPSYGGTIQFSGLAKTVLHADVLKKGDTDQGSVAAGVTSQYLKPARISLTSVYDFNTHGVASLSGNGTIKLYQRTIFLLAGGLQDQKIDSTRYYEYYVNGKHMSGSAACRFLLNDNIDFVFQYGVLLYADSAKHSFDFDFRYKNASLEISRKMGNNASAVDVFAAYAVTPLKNLDLAAGTGLTQYTLTTMKTRRTSFTASLNASYVLFQNLAINSEYQLLKNRYFEYDNRLFAGLLYRFNR